MNNILDQHALFKRLPNISQNSKLHLGLPLHYRNPFLLKIKFLKIILKRKTYLRKMSFIIIVKSTEISSLH